jgi:ribose transport system permease protein
VASSATLGRPVALGRGLRANWMPVAILAIVLLATAVLAPEFFQWRNILNVARQGSVVGVIAIGMTFVILTAGIDLSVGSILALCAVVTAMVIESGVPVIPAMIIAIALGVGVGIVNGLGIAFLGLQPFIMTLATMVLFRGVALRITDGTPKSFVSDHPLLGFFGSEQLGPFPGPLLIFAFIALAGFLVLRYLPFGRFIYAVGGSMEAARLSGVRTNRTIIAAYAISGGCAGIAGVMVASRLSTGDPVGGNLAELDAIAAVVIGGTSLMGGIGGVAGTVAGALLLAVLSNVLNLIGVSPFDQQIVKGLVIVGAVLLAARATRRRFRERGASRAASGGSPGATPEAVPATAQSRLSK